MPSAASCDQRPQVVDVRVHATVRDEAQQVHVAAARARAREGADEGRVLEERPSATARLTRTRSWSRTRPEPIVRCPTSEFPIWPGGRPTASPDATSVVCG